jgi:ATP-binding cassette subfamily B protein
VGDIGGSLSGGERQRISIARAVLKDAPIVILDEPTAALDTESELAVQKAIDTLVLNKTVIVIAHRLSTIAGADQILVVDDGRLVEQGSHQELLAKKGRYNDLWQAQLRTKQWHM